MPRAAARHAFADMPRRRYAHDAAAVAAS